MGLFSLQSAMTKNADRMTDTPANPNMIVSILFLLLLLVPGCFSSQASTGFGISAFEAVGYEGWAAGEMIPQYAQGSDQLIYNTSASMERIMRGEL